MPANTNTILLVLALICFVIAALPVAKSPVNFTAIGLALLTASFLVA